MEIMGGELEIKTILLRLTCHQSTQTTMSPFLNCYVEIQCFVYRPITIVRSTLMTDHCRVSEPNPFHLPWSSLPVLTLGLLREASHIIGILHGPMNPSLPSNLQSITSMVPILADAPRSPEQIILSHIKFTSTCPDFIYLRILHGHVS